MVQDIIASFLKFLNKFKIHGRWCGLLLLAGLDVGLVLDAFDLLWLRLEELGIILGNQDLLGECTHVLGALGLMISTSLIGLLLVNAHFLRKGRGGSILASLEG